MTNSKKRGFTIIELVIVIAVIAILAGVLIPTFVSVIKKANVSSDTALVRNINEALAAEDVTDKPTTMNQALKVAKEYGFSVEKLTPRSSGEIVWNSTSNRFALVEDGKVVYSANGEQIPNDASVWKIAHEEKGLDAKYSNYLAYEVAAETTLTVTSGLDVGENTGVNVIYNGTQNVTIRTNGGTLEINAENSEVAHYGAANLVNIVAVKDHSFHEYGTVAVVTITSGRFVAESSAKVLQVHADAATAKLEEKSGATVFEYTKSFDGEIAVENSTKTVAKTEKKTSDIIEAGKKTELVAENGVAEINGIQFKDLQSAFNAAKDNDTIVVNSDVVIDDTIIFDTGKTVVLNLNGKTISNVNDIWSDSSWSLVSVRGTSKLTITGNGTLKAKKNDCFTVDLYDVGAKCIIENGTFNGNVHAVYVYEGELLVKGGTYSVQQKYSDASKADGFVLNCYDDSRKAGTAKISVTGGTFEHFNPADCWAEGANTNFCADGYTVIQSLIPNASSSDFQYTVVKAN